MVKHKKIQCKLLELFVLEVMAQSVADFEINPNSTALFDRSYSKPLSILFKLSSA